MQTEHSEEFNLKNIREAFGMTQSGIAEEIGVTPVYISLFERNKHLPEYAKQAIECWITSQETVTK
jgi:DNA-binding XRE family transcriptional regulator